MVTLVAIFIVPSRDVLLLYVSREIPLCPINGQLFILQRNIQKKEVAEFVVRAQQPERGVPNSTRSFEISCELPSGVTTYNMNVNIFDLYYNKEEGRVPTET